MRNRGDSEQGPFQAKATVLTSPDHIRGLLEQMQTDGHRDDRQTREMDPATFRNLRDQAATVVELTPEIELVEPAPPAVEARLPVEALSPEPSPEPLPEPVEPVQVEQAHEPVQVEPVQVEPPHEPVQVEPPHEPVQVEPPREPVQVEQPRAPAVKRPAIGRSAVGRWYLYLLVTFAVTLLLLLVLDVQ